ncbi:hypothetical protein ES703_22730 [subsurface metagenome]
MSKSTGYRLDIALDSKFSEKVISGLAKASSGSTVVQVVGPNQGAGAAQTYEFMPGVTYYWRVKATTPVRSPYSETRSFTYQTLEVPFDVSGPVAGARDVSIVPVLTWGAYPEAIRYQLSLCEDPSFQILEWSHNVDNTFYALDPEIDGALSYSTTYYWRVRGVTGESYTVGRSVITPAGPWITGVFTTEAEPVVTEPTVITIPEPAEPPEVQIVKVPETTVVQQAIPDWMLLTIIIIGAVLVIALIVLIVRTRRIA